MLFVLLFYHPYRRYLNYLFQRYDPHICVSTPCSTGRRRVGGEGGSRVSCVRRINRRGRRRCGCVAFGVRDVQRIIIIIIIANPVGKLGVGGEGDGDRPQTTTPPDEKRAR